MKKPLITLLILAVFALPVIASEKENTFIKNIVNQWNEAQNAKNLAALKELYGITVFYYGRYMEQASVLKKKNAFFSKDTYQEIVSPIVLHFYNSGNIKCDFTKRVTYKGEPKEYPAYLLVQKRDGKYIIAGESDAITDKNVHAEISLGNEVGKTINKSALVYIILGSLLAGAGLFYIIKKRRDKIAANRLPIDGSVFLNKEQTESDDIKEINNPISNLGNLKNETTEIDDSNKGEVFEKFVVDRFVKEYFEIKNWRSDKYHNGRYATTNTYPDLEIILTTKYKKVSFAVECKWRKEFFNGTIECAKEYQLKNYRAYALDQNQKVFIVLGVGGTPSNPASLYIIPLEEMYTTTYTENQLKQFFRHSAGNFFFDTTFMRLG